MSAKEPEQVIRQFAEVVQALRSTLGEEQQSILDGLVSGAVIGFDVEGHALVSGAAVARNVNAAMTPAAALKAAASKEQDDIEDVEAHAMTHAASVATAYELVVNDGLVIVNHVDPKLAQGL